MITRNTGRLWPTLLSAVLLLPVCAGATGEPAVPVRGRVADSEDRPLAGAKVAVAALSQGLVVLNGSVVMPGDAVVAETSADGRFAFDRPTEPFLLVALHDVGYVEAASQEVGASAILRVQPWGQVQGTVNVGGRPWGRKGILLVPEEFRDPDSPTILYYHRGRTDAEGRFAFARVAPGEYRATRPDAIGDGTAHTHGVFVEVAPGQTVTVAVGGVGRPVVGRVIVPPQARRQIDWTNANAGINSQLPDVPLPEGFDEMTPGQQADWEAEWLRSEQGRAWRRAERHHLVLVRADGTFRVEDVAAGGYELEVDLYGSPPAGTPFTRGELIGCVSHAFEVPQMPGGRSDEPLDLGALPLRLRREPATGEPAPEFEVGTLAGGRLSLADRRGKFVLVTFWATWWTACRAEARHLAAVHEAFGGRDDFVMVGLSLDPDAEALQAYAAEKGVTWPQGLLGDWSATDLPDAYGVHRIPASFLIGPDGRVIAGDLRATAIKPAVAAALPPD